MRRRLRAAWSAFRKPPPSEGYLRLRREAESACRAIDDMRRVHVHLDDAGGMTVTDYIARQQAATSKARVKSLRIGDKHFTVYTPPR
jgi:hypothetical protein